MFNDLKNKKTMNMKKFIGIAALCVAGGYAMGSNERCRNKINGFGREVKNKVGGFFSSNKEENKGDVVDNSADREENNQDRDDRGNNNHNNRR